MRRAPACAPVVRVLDDEGSRHVKLLHTREARIVEGTIRGTPPDAALVIDGRSYGVLEATEAGLQIVDATDAERGALVEAGYALPAHLAPDEETS